MKPHHTLVSSLCLALILVADFARPAATPPPVTLPEAPEANATEKGCLDGRVADYLERHGDYGRIDPELLLELSRDFHEQMQRQPKVLAPSAIGGSVWRSIGPTNGAGRATALALHPVTAGDVITGAAGGGAWKTTDAGATWRALTETIPNLSVGAIARPSSSPDIVYLGTGEGGIAFDFIPGIGLLQSSDGGESWNLPATVLSTQFYRILVHPENPLELVVGVRGGAFRSTGGQNGPWTRVIESASGAGVTGYGDVADMVRDPVNPNVLYAATFDRRAWCQRGTCNDPLAFVSPTLLKSTDGGQTWRGSATGLPLSTATERVGRHAIAIAPSNPAILYLATSVFSSTTGIETSRIYKTTDSGARWVETALSRNSSTTISRYMGTQGWYDNTIVVSPTDPNTVLAGGVTYVKTTDGGATWGRPAFNGSSVHVDVHDLRYDSAGTLWIANDGGIWTSPDHGNSAVDRTSGLVTRQFYALASDPANRNRVFGGQQDNGTIRRGDAGGTEWDVFGGGDGFQGAIIEAAPSIVFGTFQFGAIYRTMDGGASTIVRRTLSPPYATGEATPFFSIITQHPTTAGTMFTGSHRVWKSVTGGDAWVPLPITTSDSSVWSTTTTIRSLAIARSNPDVMMVAKGARLFRSTNGGTSWFQVESGLPGRSILNVEIDGTDENRIYVALAGTTGSSVYDSINGGTTWDARGSGLPPFSTQVVRVDPTDAETLYAGTDVGVYRSTDRGASWSRFGTGLPAVSVYDIQAFRDGSGLRAATHGRGMWELTVTGSSNTPPSAVIGSLQPVVSVAKGAQLSLQGSFTDINPGDEVTGKWFFSDDWTATPASSGIPSTHTFASAGKFAVSLSATDSKGATTAAITEVTVLEPGDSCSSPLIVPPNGPFPLTFSLNTDGSTLDPQSDPLSNDSCLPFALQRSIWMSFTPEISGSYDFSLCGSAASAVVRGFTGPSCGPYVNSGFCVRSFSPDSDCTRAPRTSAQLTAGQTIRLMVSPYFTRDFGPMALTVTRSNELSTVITSAVPSSGGTAGGTTILISGFGFTPETSVVIGGVPARNVRILSPTLLEATTGANIPGTFDIVASNGTAPATLKEGFTHIKFSRRRVVRP